jgi:hypothetical protein
MRWRNWFFVALVDIVLINQNGAKLQIAEHRRIVGIGQKSKALDFYDVNEAL